ncbi:leucine-rich repeat-containing G-protein coupled receptor 5 [Daktulosphaira vitifoliae]|uniref:leucine-rich repeat-containing G-protein coupled receptor 5 n=1 Tax=Daktulosphaira vitifoliae TaxID=58002 RepID=UPI0021A97ADC|nr:leucine-rich repeat-containing G-protein coupled receptor 5 [Daktulosphaira vitifoliae]
MKPFAILMTTLSLMTVWSSHTNATVNFMQTCDSPVQCRCDKHEPTEVNCRNTGLVSVPEDVPIKIVKLDLASNNITEINEKVFGQLTLLEDLVIADNPIKTIHPKAFLNNVRLKRLSLQKCQLVRAPCDTFQHFKQLTSLQLDQNQFTEIDGRCFDQLSQLKNLWLENNKLTKVPKQTLSLVPTLEAINLGSNSIVDISNDSFSSLPNLIILLLKRNQIGSIDESAFESLTSLRILELDDNQLDTVPTALIKLTSLQELSLSGNNIKYIPDGILQRSQGLTLLELKGNPLIGVHPYAFASLPKLRKLVLSEARELTEFPNLNGTSALEFLRIDRASIYSIPDSLCITSPEIKSLDIKWNKLSRIPNLNKCKNLRLLDLANNHISSLEGSLFRNLSRLHDLLLSYNYITSVPRDAFYGLLQLKVLDLESNKISHIDDEAFLAFSQLEDLNVGKNIFEQLPTKGLERLLHLKTFNNPNLRQFPSPEYFPRIQTLVLSYAYHCCSFLPLQTSDDEKVTTHNSLHESVIFPANENEFDMTLWNSSMTDIWPQLQNLSKKFGTQVNDLWDSFGTDFTYPGNLPAYMEEYFEEQLDGKLPEIISSKVKCLPLPGPFLPCQDLFDWWTLRCGVWVVFLLAMLGNGTVVFVLIFARSKIDVPRFLVCNLAAADFFMGLYLGILAVVDAGTLGEFKIFAIPWQMSVGCQLAGVLAVLSSELSVYTLAVITLERNYAITHAMHLNKRLSLKHASYIMLCGWIFAGIMAALPLFGVSDYRKFATCLPFETTTSTWSLVYVVFLMFINGVAFFILMGCYLKMYCAIRGSQAWNSNDSRIAKRMALLVFTDLLCWAPIAFVSLTAIAGYRLVSLEQAKVFTVFVLPLNSCCNPFLYAILTKQFKKDCVMICKAIEESRVTRGIGRCRHSSNFSNRQTPANTNSLVDRSSRDNYPHPPCSCNVKLLDDKSVKTEETIYDWMSIKFQRFMSCVNPRQTESGRQYMRSDRYAYQIAEIQQKQHKRASSMSSSENYSSSRSDSWRHNHHHHHHHHHCGGVPLRLLDPKQRRASSWIVTRKTSQDSNLSSSRNDSSGSANTASTSISTRASRSSVGGSSEHSYSHHHSSKQKPRLTRQSAVLDDPVLTAAELIVAGGITACGGGCSPTGKLTVRFLATIPSAAETSTYKEDTDGEEELEDRKRDGHHLQDISSHNNENNENTALMRPETPPQTTSSERTMSPTNSKPSSRSNSKPSSPEH